MSEFANVDTSRDPSRLASYLDGMSALGAVAAGKHARASRLGLRPGGRVIDVGCGLGDDARALGPLVGPRGQIVGLDASTAMLERARARAGDEPVLFVAGDAHRLPFEAGTFDAARTERTLQHLADPTAAVRELVRVTRAGGMVMASEPDWGAAAMTGAPQRLVRALLKAAEAKIRNPWIGRELAGLFVDAGVLEIEVGAEALVLRDFDTIRAMTDLPTLIAELRADGEQKANDLEAEIEADAKAGRAVAAITLFTVTGRVA